MRAIVFSKDRACQLDLLLTSLKKNDPQPLFDDIHVIYYASSYDFAIGYNIVSKKFPYVNFHEQSNFKNDVLKLLHTCYSHYLAFFVDDIIVYREIDFFENEVDELFRKFDTSIVCLSLRLGRNTTFLYQEDRTMATPVFRYEGNFLLWNRYTMPHTENFNYPLSVDAHIFRTQDITHWSSLIHFTNPNNYESNLHIEWQNKVPPLMTCCEKSIIVNAPVNRVQDQFRNKFGTVHSFSPQGLNKHYLEGKTIDLDLIDSDRINASHQELEFNFK